jgi:outer membrane biosynthesis protein TonB
MDRAEKIGLGVAVVGHAVLFGLLSVGFLATPNPVKFQQQPVEVSLVKDVGLEATAPQAVEPPAQSVAPEQGSPEEAAPPAEPEPASEPKPVAPTPLAKAQPAPAPAPEPKPALAKSAPAPKPVPKPVAKPAPAKPAPKPAAPTKSAAKSPAAGPAKTTPKPAAASSVSAAKGSGSSATATAQRPRGSRLGNDFLKGLTSDPSPSRSEAPRAARIDARALTGIQDAISRQIQPCADRQIDPGPGANRIVTVLNLRLNENGTLAATPTMVRQSGINDENERYARRVVDLGIAAFKGCSPLRLPAEFYSTPGGGWNNINYTWQLR